MRLSARGFSLVENVFAAMIIAVVILGMSTIISAYTVNKTKTQDRPFAVNLAQQMLDEFQMKLSTQNAMVYDNAWVDCPDSAHKNNRGRSYYIKSENLTVSQYFFNIFPYNAVPDPCAVGREMGAIPWNNNATGSSDPPLPTDIKDQVYYGAVAPEGIPFIQYTPFYRPRIYTAGGDLMPGPAPAGYPDAAACKLAMSGDSPPRFAVRFQVFGIPAALSSDPTFDIGAMVRSSERLAANAYPDDPRTPPAASPFLMGDSCITGPSVLGGATGRLYLRERTASGEDKPGEYFPHFTAKVLVARVYRIDDYIDDGTFYAGADKPDTEISSASVVLVGRVQRK